MSSYVVVELTVLHDNSGLYDFGRVRFKHMPTQGEAMRFTEIMPEGSKVFVELVVSEVCWWEDAEGVFSPEVTAKVVEREWDLHPPTPKNLQWSPVDID